MQEANVPYEHHIFRSIEQTDKTIEQYSLRLRAQTKFYDFGTAENNQIRDNSRKISFHCSGENS